MTVVGISTFARYSLAVALAIAFGALHAATRPTWDLSMPFVLLLPAIVGSAYLGGVGPGTTTTVLSAVIAWIFWLEPASEVVGLGSVVTGLAVFMATGVVVSVLCESLISTRAQAERQAEVLERANERLALAQSFAGAGVWDWSVGARTVYWSPAHFQVLGRSPDEEPTYAAFLASIAQVDRERVHTTVQTYQKDDAACRIDIAYRVERGGTTHWLRTLGRIERGADGKPVHAAGITVDVTEATETRLALRESEERLQAIVDAMSALVFVKDLEGRYLLVGKHFEAVVGRSRESILGHTDEEIFGSEAARSIRAHDAEVAQAGQAVESEERAPRCDGELRDYLSFKFPLCREGGQVYAVGGVAADITERKRHEEAVEKDKLVVRREPLDLGGLARAAVETLSARGETRRHHVDLALDEVWVSGDPTRLDQVVTNLVANALKYTPEGRGVRVTLAREGEAAVLVVEDEGRGMDAALKARVFDLFVQGEQSLDRPAGGLGIGLTLVRRIVELHGGTVEAESEGAGRGSRFVVRLPARARAAARRHESAAVVRPRRILVVEDHDDSREMLRALLEAAGHEVREAADGAAAVAAALAWRPDLVLLDVGLPVFDGYEAARRIRAAGGRMRLVALTGYGQREDVARSLEAGFDQHVVKPIGATQLAALVRPPAGLVASAP